MFTGIVEKSVRVLSVAVHPGFRRITLACDWPDVKLGQSVAVNGCCLTIAKIESGSIGFDVIPETLDKTNLGLLEAGSLAHVERSLCVGDRLDGHFVQGHVDGRATSSNESISRMKCASRYEHPIIWRSTSCPKAPSPSTA